MAKKTKKESKFLDLKNIDKATEAAVYYGFMPIELPEIEKEDRDKAKTLKDGEPMPEIGTNEKSAILPKKNPLSCAPTSIRTWRLCLSRSWLLIMASLMKAQREMLVSKENSA